MTKNLFQPGEVKKKDGEFKLSLVHDFYVPAEEVAEDEIPQYTGPSIEDVQKEIEAARQKWETEKLKLMEEAQSQAEQIVSQAKETAFNEIKRQRDEAQVIKTDAEKSAEEMLQKAKDEAVELKAKAEDEVQEIKKNAFDEGRKQGVEDGFNSGREEVSRLIERCHTILEAVMSRRQEILNETEQQIVDLVLLISRKVVKIMSENQKQVVMGNVLQALKKVKARGNVTIRVNMDDVKITTENISNFIRQVESVQGITVVEDGTVDKGGCIIETDFGSIDARISSQLAELEAKILELSPGKTAPKNAQPSEK